MPRLSLSSVCPQCHGTRCRLCCASACLQHVSSSAILRAAGSGSPKAPIVSQHDASIVQVLCVRPVSSSVTHRATLAVWKGILTPQLPMSDDLAQVFVWGALAFETTLPVPKHGVNAIRAWHPGQRLRLRVPLAGLACQ